MGLYSNLVYLDLNMTLDSLIDSYFHGVNSLTLSRSNFLTMELSVSNNLILKQLFK